MFKKLQFRFIAITTLSITIVMIVLLVVLNIYNYRATYAESYRILRYIAENGGELGDVNEQVSVERIVDDREEENTSGTAVPEKKSFRDFMSSMIFAMAFV